LIEPLDRLIVNFVLSLPSPGGPGGPGGLGSLGGPGGAQGVAVTAGGGEVCVQTLAVMTLLLFTPG